MGIPEKVEPVDGQILFLGRADRSRFQMNTVLRRGIHRVFGSGRCYSGHR